MAAKSPMSAKENFIVILFSSGESIKIDTRPVGGAFYMCSLISPLSLVTWPFARDTEIIIPECILAGPRCIYASAISQFFLGFAQIALWVYPHWKAALEKFTPLPQFS